MAPAQGWHANSWSVPNFSLPSTRQVFYKLCTALIRWKSHKIYKKWTYNFLINSPVSPPHLYHPSPLRSLHHTKNRILFCYNPPHVLQNIFEGSFRIIFMTEKAYDTGSSQAVPHPSTIPARRCLTSVIGRERVFSSWYGRRHLFRRYFRVLLPICFVSRVNHKWF